jgi:hypothetical protein
MIVTMIHFLVLQFVWPKIQLREKLKLPLKKLYNDIIVHLISFIISKVVIRISVLCFYSVKKSKTDFSAELFLGIYHVIFSAWNTAIKDGTNFLTGRVNFLIIIFQPCFFYQPVLANLQIHDNVCPTYLFYHML